MRWSVIIRRFQCVWIWGQGFQINWSTSPLQSSSFFRVLEAFAITRIRIDSWDWEYTYFILEEHVITEIWNWDTKEVRCGQLDAKEDYKSYVWEFFHQPTLAVIITTNLDDIPFNESWGFRMLRLKLCYVQQDVQCVLMIRLMNAGIMNQLNQILLDNFNFDGWTLDNQQFLGSSSCVSIQQFRGIDQITGNKQLSNNFLFQFHVTKQSCKFSQDNNEFQIEINGQLRGQVLLNQFGIASLCGDNTIGEELSNILLVKTHTSDNVQIKMKANVASSSGSWGLRAFRLFLVKCYQTCFICSQSNKNDCSLCKTGYILHNFECVDVKWILALKQYFQPQDFQTQSGWTISYLQNNQSPFQICSNTNLLGGYSLFSKDDSVPLTFELPKHTKIRVKLEFWKFSSWDNEWFKLFANGIFRFEFNHIQQTLNLALTALLDKLADNEPWRIRNFELLFGVQKFRLQACIYQKYLFIIKIIINLSDLAKQNRNIYLQSKSYSIDQTWQNKIEISELGISKQPNFDQTISVDSSIKKQTLKIVWNCFQMTKLFLFPQYKAVIQTIKQDEMILN